MARFEDILTIVNGKNQKKVENPNGKYPIYGSGGIMGYADDYICEAETVIIGRKGSINNPIFVETPFWNVDTAFGLHADCSKLFPKYLYYFCVNYDFERLNTTVTIPSLTKANLLNVEIPLPPLEEQRRIAALLDKVSDLITKRRAQLDKLDLLVKARFVEMFDGIYEQVLLSDVAEITGGLTKNSKRKDLPIKLPYLRVANVFFDTIDTNEILEIGLTEEEKSKTLLQKGDLLFVEGNGSPEQIGRVAVWRDEIVPCVHQNHLIKARFNMAKMLPIYAMNYFMTQKGREQIREKAVSTSGLYTLSVSKIESLHIPFAPMDTQLQFTDFKEKVDKSKMTIYHSLDKLETLKKALMQQYFG